MRRIDSPPRPAWQDKVAASGFPIHSLDGPYWHESACYEFTPAEIALLENATAELHARALDAVARVISRRLYSRFGIPERAIPLIEASWEENEGDGDPSIYGRMDLAFDGSGPPKLLEYNADTPTALIEAAVLQWSWLEEVRPQGDQWNSIHERLVEGWRGLAPWLRNPLYFASLDTAEDLLTTTYLQDTAAQAGLSTRFLKMADVGWNASAEAFVDLSGERIGTIFKLYPWEWMFGEEFGRRLSRATRWIEPTWKMLLSNKRILEVLWETFPGHPNLLQALPTPDMASYARKPVLGREGAAVTLIRDGETIAANPGFRYELGSYTYQELAPLASFGGCYPVIGSWVIGGEPAGMGIRESDGPITTNTSRFVPHAIEGRLTTPRPAR